MNIVISQINEQEFNNLNIQILFSNNNNTDRCFGIITNHILSYRFSWQSDMIQPLLTKVKSGIYSIGIDQKFAIVDFNLGAIVFYLELNYTFYDTKIFDNLIYLNTELEILIIDSVTFEVIKEYPLPDIFGEIIKTNEKITVRCLDNSIIDIN
jgi:hypothetical protein